MDKFLEIIRDRLTTSFLIIVLGVLLLIVGASDTISIGGSSSQISLTQPIRFILWIPALVLISAGLWQQLKHSNKIIKSREKITLENKRLIVNAEREVISFSGDLSWTENLHSAIIAAVDQETSIKILCKDPLTEKAKSHVQRYLQQPGIEVKYYPSKLDPDVRGIMADPQTLKHLLLVEKEHKTKGFDYQRTGLAGSSENYQYWGQLLTAKEDFSVVAPIAKLFDVVWDLSDDATVINGSDWKVIEKELKQLRQYSNAKISLALLRTADLLPLHRFLELSRYEAIKVNAARLQKHGIPLWSNYSLLTSSYRRNVCPPIVESHNDGKFVVIDGLSRIYEAKRLGLTEVTVCVIDGVAEPLVGIPWEWEEVRVVADGTYPQQDNFQNFMPEYWRQIKKVVKELTDLKN